MRYTPITRPFERVAELSWQIARGRGLSTSATAEKDSALLLDVAELWELFLVHCARKAFGAANVTHGTTLNSSRSLLRSTVDPSTTMGRLYPDIIIGPLDNQTLIIDAKYKPLNDYRGVDREDLYQLHAYVHAYASAEPPGMLAYPDLGVTPQPRAQRLGPWLLASGQSVSFVRCPVTEPACIEHLRSMPGTQLATTILPDE